MNLAILFGSSSNEHDVSILSACSIIHYLDKEKYHITPIYLDKDNNFYYWYEDIAKISIEQIGFRPSKLKKIDEPFTFLKQFDVVFLMIHGKNGEDGTLPAILDFLNIPYVGNKIAPSVITMDKIYTKEILELNHIKTSLFVSLMKYNDSYIMDGNIIKLSSAISKINQLHYPLFVKPANSGSSIGITKVDNKGNLNNALEEDFKIDNRILIEEGIVGRELECAILEEHGNIRASKIGEVKTANTFYSFSSKYESQDNNTIIPAILDKKTEKRIQEIAILAFQVLNLHGYSRIDFFLKDNGEIILNEINTIPGFTSISMYPKLWEESNILYSKLLDILISEKCRK